MSFWSDFLNSHSLFEFGTFAAEAALVVVLAPELLRHYEAVRERHMRIGLNIDQINPRKNQQAVYGVDSLTADIGDFIDRAKNPLAYAALDAGNEILIVGAPQSGKKALALQIARMADIGRAIIVYNPRDPDVLACAKSMIEDRLPYWRRVWNRLRNIIVTQPILPGAEKTMLLLPGLDSAYGNKGEAWCDQLEALIETASSLPHILVVGTATLYEREGEVASWFGTILSMPEPDSEAWRTMIRDVAEGFMKASASRYSLSGIEPETFIETILQHEPTPAEIKDIFAQCQTLATARLRARAAPSLLFTADILNTAIRRVIPPLA